MAHGCVFSVLVLVHVQNLSTEIMKHATNMSWLMCVSIASSVSGCIWLGSGLDTGQGGGEM